MRDDEAFMKKRGSEPIQNRKAYTLLEILITIVMISILIGIAIPRYAGTIERSKAAEGIQILGVVRSSQERYALEHGNYPSETAHLDVVIPALKNFQNPLVLENCCDTTETICATIQRAGELYQLRIACDGIITCEPSSSCPSLGL